MKILIVESNLVFAKMLAAALKTEDDSVEVDVIGTQTLLERRLASKEFDLIIADVFCTCGGHCLDMITETKSRVIWMTSSTIQKDSDWILSVDDDDVDAKLLERQLQSVPGTNCVRAKDGEDALKIMRIAKNKPKFIVLDLNMPNMDGIAFTNAVRKDPVFMDIPIIVVSASPENAQQAFDSGVDAFLEKPIDSVSLFGKINDCVVDMRKPRTELEFDSVASQILGGSSCQKRATQST